MEGGMPPCDAMLLMSDD